MDRYAVIGNPIAHSKSPFIHQAFAQQTGQELVYEAILASHETFPQVVIDFHQAGGKGLNITTPFKEQAYRLADQRTPRAERVGAVNTICFQQEGSVLGDNTDGVGLVNDLQNNLRWPIQQQRILILGAGGAARGIIPALLAEKPALIVIVNRTLEKAMMLAEQFSELGPIAAYDYPALPQGSFNFIINATTASLQGELPPLTTAVIAHDTRCYDLFYSNQLTPFLRWSADQGVVKFADGLGMLVEQAAESFYLWRGVRPDTAPVLRDLKKIF